MMKKHELATETQKAQKNGSVKISVNSVLLWL